MPENPTLLPIASKAVTYLGLGGHEVIKVLQRAVRAPAVSVP
ncbi:hypothetical protein [Rhizobium sp. ZW T2_16]